MDYRMKTNQKTIGILLTTILIILCLVITSCKDPKIEKKEIVEDNLTEKK